MRYIVSAESKSLFNYGNRTEKIFRPTTMDISRGRKSEKSGQRCGRGFGIAGMRVQLPVGIQTSEMKLLGRW